MKPSVTGLVVMALALFASAPLAAKSEAECAATWKELDGNEDGVVLGDKAAPYLKELKAANALKYDTTTLTAEQFMQGCRADVFKTLQP